MGPLNAVGVESELDNVKSATFEIFGGFRDDDSVLDPIMVWTVGRIILEGNMEDIGYDGGS